jgi:hypothetical protein
MSTTNVAADDPLMQIMNTFRRCHAERFGADLHSQLDVAGKHDRGGVRSRWQASRPNPAGPQVAPAAVVYGKAGIWWM